MTLELAIFLLVVVVFIVLWVWAIYALLNDVWDSRLDTVFKILWTAFIFSNPALCFLCWFAFCHFSPEIRRS